jgi:hypothetical protein
MTGALSGGCSDFCAVWIYDHQLANGLIHSCGPQHSRAAPFFWDEDEKDHGCRTCLDTCRACRNAYFGQGQVSPSPAAACSGIELSRLLCRGKQRRCLEHRQYALQRSEYRHRPNQFYSKRCSFEFYALSANWSAFVQYNFMGFGRRGLKFNDHFGGFTEIIREDVHVVKAGINYRFNWGGPLAASR